MTPAAGAAHAPETAGPAAPARLPLQLVRPHAAGNPAAVVEAACRFCGGPLPEPFLDLGMAPLANRYLRPSQLYDMEPFYPLQVHRCPSCSLAQLRAFETPENIFGDYAYFSSFSESWLRHAREYVEAMIGRFGFDAGTQVVELASNDGELLQYFKRAGISVLGI